MEIMKSLAVQAPTILACILFGIAALLKVGKEKGAIAVLLGAIGSVVLSIANPLVYSVIMPRVVRNMEGVNFQYAYLAAQSIMSIFWGGAITLVAIGILMRSPAVNKPSAGQTSGVRLRPV